MSSIEIDCAPFTPRPDTLLPNVLKGTGLKLKKPTLMLFGNWEWVIPKAQEKRYQKHKKLIKERITNLYKTGQIRYGSW